MNNDAEINMFRAASLAYLAGVADDVSEHYC